MESVVIASKNIIAQRDLMENHSVQTFLMDGIEIGCGLLEIDDVSFDRTKANLRNSVLVKKLAISCNYRDRSFLRHIAMHAEAADDKSELIFSCVGSEFVGEVAEVGIDVRTLVIGDRVIPNCSYPYSDNLLVTPGIPTNEASSKWQVLDEGKLVRINDAMRIEHAAGFSIGAQTTFGMISKLNLDQESRILVTSASSNTSLFLISALKKYPNLVVATSSASAREKLATFGVKNFMMVDYKSKSLIVENNYAPHSFDVIIDPFIDTHITSFVKFLALNGRYVTCGIFNQSGKTNTSQQISEQSMIATFAAIVAGNLTIIGNCLGSSDDLRKALHLYDLGELDVHVDSIYKGDQVKEFLERTFNCSERFGKVIYRY